MSLVGSLEDLGLVDILQIVSLSRKSGVLMLRSDSGEGRIVLRDGLAQAAAIKGEVEDLRSLLISEGCADAGSFTEAEALAASESIALDDALERTCGIDAERLVALRREHVERSVMRMFGWRAGEFSFEIRDDLGEQDDGLRLPTGLNTQYLAMEAARMGDEAGPADDANEEEEDGMMFSGESGATSLAGSPSAAKSAVDAVAEVAIDRVEREAADGDDADVDSPADAGEEVAIEAPTGGDTRVPVSVSGGLPLVPTGTLVAIDADLSTLEWLKASVDGIFERTHIFQRRDSALVRIRQYLVRGTVPIVVLADAPADRRGPDAENFAERLRSLAPAMPILALCAENDSLATPACVDGVLRRPTSPSPDPDRWHLYEPLAERVRSELAPWLAGDPALVRAERSRDSSD